MPKLRHVALQVNDPETTATFFEQAFDMKRIGSTDAGISHGIYLSDGTINLAILHFKTDEAAGVPACRRARILSASTISASGSTT